jgi:hypothetical protein
MTTAMPGGGPSDDESGGRPMDDDEISRRFSEIVSPMSQSMEWDVSDDEFDAAAPGSDQRSADYRLEAFGGPFVDSQEPDTAERRRQRREHRKANRSAEAAAFAAEQARREAEYAEDDQHYVPGEPPPLTMPKVRTLIALLLIACGIFLLVGPNLLTISPDGVLIVAAILVLCGGSLLVSGLRHRAQDPGEGWDDGSRV